jgi:hypothetical protein
MFKEILVGNGKPLGGRLEAIIKKSKSKEPIVDKGKDELKEAYDELKMCLDNFREAPGKFRDYWGIRITAAEAKIQVILGEYKKTERQKH